MLVTALASALGIAVVAGPAADAAKPAPPPPVGKLVITSVLDDETILPEKAPHQATVGLVRQSLEASATEDPVTYPFTIVVQSQTNASDPTGEEAPVVLLPMSNKTDVTVTYGGVKLTGTIPKDGSEVVFTGQTWFSSANFKVTATAAKTANLAQATLPVTVAREFLFKEPGDVLIGQQVGVKDGRLGDCVLSSTNPTCVTLSVSDTDSSVTTVDSNVVLSTSDCAGFLDGTATGDFDCVAKKGITPLVAQTFVDLAEGQVATAILYCDKSRCGNGGVSQYIPLVDKGNTGNFIKAPECPARGELGTLPMCVDLRQSTRLNAGDLATYILFNDDARSLH